MPHQGEAIRGINVSIRDGRLEVRLSGRSSIFMRLESAGIFGFERRELAWEGRKIGTMYLWSVKLCLHRMLKVQVDLLRDGETPIPKAVRDLALEMTLLNLT